MSNQSKDHTWNIIGLSMHDPAGNPLILHSSRGMTGPTPEQRQETLAALLVAGENCDVAAMEAAFSSAAKQGIPEDQLAKAEEVFVSLQKESRKQEQQQQHYQAKIINMKTCRLLGKSCFTLLVKYG